LNIERINSKLLGRELGSIWIINWEWNIILYAGLAIYAERGHDISEL